MGVHAFLGVIFLGWLQATGCASLSDGVEVALPLGDNEGAYDVAFDDNAIA